MKFPKPSIITRRGLLTGAAALAAYSALPKDAEAWWQSRDSAYNNPVSGGGGGFNPVSLVTGSGGFWRADMGVTGSPNVTAWADQSSNAFNLSLVSGDTSPQFSATSFNTSFPGLTFTGNGSNGLGTGTITTVGATTLSVFALLKGAGTGGAARYANQIVAGSDTNSPAWTVFDNGVGQFYEMFSSGGQGNSGGGFGSSVNTMPGWVFDGTNCTAYLNGSVQGGTTAFTATLGAASSSFNIGNSSLQITSGMVLAYFLITQKAMNTTDIGNLKTWTNSNWGTSF